MVWFLQKRLDNEFANIALAGHAKTAHVEMVTLAREINNIITQSNVELSSNEWYRYLIEDLPPLDEGSKKIPLKWGSIILICSMIALIITIVTILTII